MTGIGVYRLEGERRSVRFEREYGASLDAVWAAVSDPEQLRGWLAVGGAVLEPRVGGSFELWMASADEVTAWGTVLAFEPPRLLEVEWRFEGEDESVLRIELEPRGDRTLLVLDHRLLKASQAGGYGAGWHAYLDALDDFLGGRSGSWDERFQSRLEDYRREAAGAGSRPASSTS
jgi:uncharacterized protein YndB with AHSA1/START domain